MKNWANFSNYLNLTLRIIKSLFLHSRLSIIDLNKRSNQPFKIWNDVIIFNGEIYNYIELKEKLIKKNKIILVLILKYFFNITNYMVKIAYLF